jgi:hypothetical protein
MMRATLAPSAKIALGRLFRRRQSGGIYIIEDLHWQVKYLERQNIPKTPDRMRRLQIDGILETPLLSEEQRRFLQWDITKIRLFDSFTRVSQKLVSGVLESADYLNLHHHQKALGQVGRAEELWLWTAFELASQGYFVYIGECRLYG